MHALSARALVRHISLPGECFGYCPCETLVVESSDVQHRETLWVVDMVISQLGRVMQSTLWKCMDYCYLMCILSLPSCRCLGCSTATKGSRLAHLEHILARTNGRNVNLSPNYSPPSLGIGTKDHCGVCPPSPGMSPLFAPPSCVCFITSHP